MPSTGGNGVRRIQGYLQQNSLSFHMRFWRALQSYSETDVFFISPNLSVFQFLTLF